MILLQDLQNISPYKRKAKGLYWQEEANATSFPTTNDTHLSLFFGGKYLFNLYPHLVFL